MGIGLLVPFTGKRLYLLGKADFWNRNGPRHFMDRAVYLFLDAFACLDRSEEMDARGGVETRRKAEEWSSSSM